MTAVVSSPRRRSRTNLFSTIVLFVGALYCVLPVLWIVIAATKSSTELFSTPTALPSFTGGLFENIAELLAYRDGIFGRWMLNSALYAGGGGIASTLIAAAAGYALAKYRFRGSTSIFRIIVAAVLLPQIMLAIPQYLLLAQFGMTNNYFSVILPLLVSPYAIYLCKIYAEASVPNEIMEAARIDGATEWRIFLSTGLRLMSPALVTVFLLQFIAIWNNFLLPFIMLTDDSKFPLTLGLYAMLRAGASQAALYSLVITGAAIAIIPVVALFLSLQRFWRLDLMSGGVKA
ncbi:carbohydrate ABC transporter permease [Microbacterium oxydans]|jgi:multiple sugar transport system permease protein|uniref:carbohydrate ABC transporter permease n=1 Tax=Microbacterium oxydans TaxID=82380 RepID=UPI00226B8F39|nr:carbohydrate ABC transporter permease [Microbacterium oxydans]WAA66535.1 carbohydrate ABC transporter permease [Microbacterium oxydans]